MGIYPFYEGGPCPSIKEQIARQFYARKDKAASRKPYRDQDGWGWTKISEAPPVPALMSTRCDAETVVYTEYPAKSGSGDSDVSENLKAIESKLVDIAEILKDLAQSCVDTANGIRDMAKAAVTAAEMEDVLRYTVVPVIVTDQGPAPKRPENGSQNRPDHTRLIYRAESPDSLKSI